MSIKSFYAGVILATAACFSGCVNVDYVGQSLAPLPEDAPVTVYTENQTYNAADYELLGRVTVTAPDGTDILAIKEELQELAREKGAEAVKLQSIKKVKTGVVYLTDGTEDTPDAYNTGVLSRSVGGDPIYTNSFGQTGELSTTSKPQYEVIIHAILLANKNEFDQAMAELKQEK